MLFSKKIYDVKKKSEKNEKKKDEKKEKKKQVQCTKVKPQLNPHCSKCSHRPSQSLTPKDEKKFQQEKNYKKLYKIT